MTLPDLLLFSDYDHDWSRYEEALHQVFMAEIARGGLTFQGQRVSCKRNPEAEGRWFSFWHLIQEGKIEEDRIPDMRRCERLRWVPYLIENGDSISDVDIWQNKRGREINTIIWYREEYLVVLSERDGYWLLKTAYCTEQNFRIARLRKERDRYLSQNG